LKLQKKREMPEEEQLAWDIVIEALKYIYTSSASLPRISGR